MNLGYPARSHRFLIAIVSAPILLASCETGMAPVGVNIDAETAAVNNAARRVTLSIIAALEQGDPDDPDDRRRKPDVLTAKIVSCPLGGMRDIQDDGSVNFDGCMFFPGLEFGGSATQTPGDNADSYRLDFMNFTVANSGVGVNASVEGFFEVSEDSSGNTTYVANIALTQPSGGDTIRQTIKSDLTIALDGTMTGFLEVGASQVGFEDFDDEPLRCDMTGISILDLLNDPNGFNAALSQNCNEDVEIDTEDPGDGQTQDGDLAVFGFVELLVEDAPAEPIADADIMVLDAESFTPLGTASSDSDGRYVVANLAEGQQVVVVASKAGFATYRGCRTIVRGSLGGFDEAGVPITIRLVKANEECQTDTSKFELTQGSAPGLAQTSPISDATKVCPDRITTYDTDGLIICISGDKAAPTFSWMDDWDMDNAKEDVTRIRVRKDGSLIYELENSNGIASPIVYGDALAGTIIDGNDGSTPLETGSFYEVILTAESVARLTFEVRP